MRTRAERTAFAVDEGLQEPLRQLRAPAAGVKPANEDNRIGLAGGGLRGANRGLSGTVFEEGSFAGAAIK